MSTANTRFVWLEPVYKSIASTSQASQADGRTKLLQFDVPCRVIVKRFAWQNGATAQDNLRVGIYRAVVIAGDHIVTPAGASLVYDSGNIAQSGTNTVQEHIVTTPLVLESGTYFLAFETTGTTMTFMRQSNQIQASGLGYEYTRAGGFGALTDPCPTVSATQSAQPAVRLLVVINGQG